MARIATLWRAGRDGVGHALAKPTALRGACGAPVVALRLAWPTRSHCAACETALGIRAA